MAPYDQVPDRGRGEGQWSDPSQPHQRNTSGLGISVPRQAHRSESRQRLVDDAEPIASSSSQAGPPSGQRLGDDPESWTPQLSGRTLGESSPSIGPQREAPSAGEFKGTIYSAWDRGSAAAAFAPLSDEKELGLAGNDDTISLDSLQMHDEDNRAYDRGFSTVREVDQGDDYDSFKKPVNNPKRSSHPPAHVRIKRRSWVFIFLISMTVYSTILSGIWLGIAIAQPRWGHKISSDGFMTLSTANMLTVIFAKTIEMTFATVFVAFVGQVLTRRAINRTEGMTMAEMIMRGWITQPGSLLSNGNTLRHTGYTLLGILTLLATMVATLYTTASDTMVRPKLRFNSWQQQELKGYVLASYSNPIYVQDSCATPISSQLDPLSAGESCLAIQYSGNSYHNLLFFMSSWHDIVSDGNTASRDMAKRPYAQAMLYDNITMTASWIETQYSNTSEQYETYERVINNVSLAFPHPGVYKAAINDVNNILQPSDLDGLGAYNISASVVSPAVNVLCVNMNKTELAPLVYTTWPNANNTDNEYSPYQPMGWDGWEGDVPVASADGEWLNATVVDDIFRWGEEYDRRPPVFQLYPVDNNIITNTTVLGTNRTEPDAIYLLGKSRLMDDYTLCEMRSWSAIQCSTLFDNSGVTGGALSAECSQGADDDEGHDPNPDAYVNVMAPGAVAANADWKNLVEVWGLSINLDVGVTNSNASNARLLTELALTAPELNDTLPSQAEALAVLASSTLVTGSVDTPFVHYWDYDWPNMTSNTLPAPGALATFRARVRSQEYASWYTSPWQGVFYVVLGAAFLLNLLCLAYLCRAGLVRDFLEPTTLFALATAKAGAAAATTRTPTEPRRAPRTDDLAVPYRLAYKEDEDVYYFEEASDGGGRGARTTGAAIYGEGGDGKSRSSLYRLSSKMRL